LDLYSALGRYATTRNVCIAFLAFVLFTAVLLTVSPYADLQRGGYGSDILETRLWYTPQEVYDAFADLGDAGRATYRSALLFDLLYPFAYVPFLTLSIAWTFNRITASRRWADRSVTLPVLAGIGDWLENAGLLAMLAGFPAIPRAFWMVVGVATTAKLVLVYVSCFLVAIGLIRVTLRRLSRDPIEIR